MSTAISTAISAAVLPLEAPGGAGARSPPVPPDVCPCALVSMTVVGDGGGGRNEGGGGRGEGGEGEGEGVGGDGSSGGDGAEGGGGEGEGSVGGSPGGALMTSSGVEALNTRPPGGRRLMAAASARLAPRRRCVSSG